MLTSPLRAKLDRGETAIGLWVTTECPSATEIAALLGLDWICVEMEHSHLGWREVASHLRVTRHSSTSPIVRVPTLGLEPIRRALDIGAHGVIVPMISTRAQLDEAMRYAFYPPEGARGIGGDRPLNYGLRMKDYVSRANEEILVIPLIESKEAVENIDDILAAPRLRAIFIGPVDMSASYGHLGTWNGPGVADRILEVRRKSEERGIAVGVIASTPEELKRRRDQGFRLLSLGSDSGLLSRSIQESLSAIGQERPPNLWF